MLMGSTIRSDAEDVATGGNARRSFPLWTIVAGMVFPSLATWLWFVALAGRSSMQAVYALTKGAQFAWPLVVLFLSRRRGIRRHAEEARAAAGRDSRSPVHRSRDDFARRKLVPKGLAAGALFGAAVAALILGVYGFGLRGTAVLGSGPAGIRAKVDQLGMATPALFVVLALFYSVAHSGLEE